MDKQNAIVTGSLSDVAERSGMSLAESFIHCEVLVIVDTSGSMCASDSRGRRKRYEVAVEELAKLQASLPGKIGVIAFSDEVLFVPGGAPPYLGGGTDLAGALRFAKQADVPDIRMIVISDGQPNDEKEALAVAATIQARIDTIFVGAEGDTLSREFLAKLAHQRGGQTTTAARVVELAASVQYLLTSPA